jgi:glutaredoxin
MMRAICLLILLCALSISSNAQVYKWTDAQGKIHYGDIPPPQAKNLEQKKASGNIIETDAEPYETKLAVQKNPVALYSFSECGDPCVKAQALLDKRGIPYKLKNADPDRAELKALTGDNRIPVLVVGKQTPLQGFEEGAWNQLLDQAGYPKNNPLAGLRKAAVKTPVAGTESSKPEPTTSPAQP